MIELVIAMGVGLVAVLIVSQLLVFLQSQFVSLQKKIRDEIEVSELAFSLHHYVAMAVHLTAQDQILTGTRFDSSYGQFLSQYNLNDWLPTHGSGSVQILGFYLRDTLSSRNRTLAPAPQDRFEATGLFFQRPTIDHYGVIYLSLDNKTSSEIRLNTSRGTNNYFFEGLVDFSIRDVITHPHWHRAANGEWVNSKMISSLTFDVTQRHYLPTIPSDKKAWCPPRFMDTALCKFGNQGYRDMTKSLVIKIKNNILGQSTLQRRRVEPTSATDAASFPPRLKRTFENIYFLRPTYPVGALKR